jgi:hypothetical protein
VPVSEEAPAIRQALATAATLPAIVLSVATVVVAYACYDLLDEAGSARASLPSMTVLIWSVVVMLGSGTTLVLVQAFRIRSRFRMPSQRLERSVRQARRGDLSFRVQLRRGDPLRSLAEEFNLFLDWLNKHPPSCDSVRLGGDVVEVFELEELREPGTGPQGAVHPDSEASGDDSPNDPAQGVETVGSTDVVGGAS